MAKSRLPTLKQIIGERPRCQYCDIELKPLTCTVEVVGHICTPPTTDELIQMPQPRPSYPSTELAVERGYQPERVFRMARIADYTKAPVTRLHFWTGKYHGYGYTDTPRLFCNNECGRLFGLAAWRAGYRVKGKSDLKPDPDDQPYTIVGFSTVDEFIAHLPHKQEQPDEGSDYGDDDDETLIVP